MFMKSWTICLHFVNQFSGSTEWFFSCRCKIDTVLSEAWMTDSIFDDVFRTAGEVESTCSRRQSCPSLNLWRYGNFLLFNFRKNECHFDYGVLCKPKVCSLERKAPITPPGTFQERFARIGAANSSITNPEIEDAEKDSVQDNITWLKE